MQPIIFIDYDDPFKWPDIPSSTEYSIHSEITYIKLSDTVIGFFSNNELVAEINSEYPLDDEDIETAIKHVRGDYWAYYRSPGIVSLRRYKVPKELTLEARLRYY